MHRAVAMESRPWISSASASACPFDITALRRHAAQEPAVHPSTGTKLEWIPVRQLGNRGSMVIYLSSFESVTEFASSTNA
jgi:hypothetical protein